MGLAPFRVCAETRIMQKTKTKCLGGALVQLRATLNEVGLLLA